MTPLDERWLPREFEVFLDRGDPSVYVGFGSSGEVDAAATTRLIVEALQIAGRLGVVLHGVGGLAHGSLPEGIIAVGDCVHTKLFPRMGAVVHQAALAPPPRRRGPVCRSVVVSHLNE